LLGFPSTAGNQQTFEDIAKKYNWNIHLRNETKSYTTPIIQIGMYKLTKIRFLVVLFKLNANASEPLIIKSNR
jgi:hypothetical protein